MLLVYTASCLRCVAESVIWAASYVLSNDILLFCGVLPFPAQHNRSENVVDLYKSCSYLSRLDQQSLFQKFLYMKPTVKYPFRGHFAVKIFISLVARAGLENLYVAEVMSC